MQNFLRAKVLWAVLVLAMSIGTPLTADAEEKGTIKIAENDWTGQLVDIHLAKIVLEEHMGYDVELVFVEYSAQWVGLANGDVDVAMEIWPAGSWPAHQEWIDEKGKVMVIGDLGVVGFTGWWVPTYMIEGDPERGIEPITPDLKTWEDLNSYTDVFQRAESGDRGFCIDSIASWVNGNTDRIKNLDLNYLNVFAGSEGALLAEIESAYTRGEPLLICDMWAPHWIHAKFDLTQIELPPYSDECYGINTDQEATYACDFPKETLYNVARAGFDQEQPEAFAFFQNFRLTNEQQEEIVYQIDVNSVDIEDAVREWMNANEDVWQAWIPTSG